MDVYLNGLRQKGYLAYEYNPFHNYQTEEDLYEVDTDIGKVLVPENKAANIKNGNILTKKNGAWVDFRNNVIANGLVREAKEIEGDDNVKLYAKAGSIIDLDTDKLNFDLEHPVDIEVQPSYDGSVNLILNDGKNIPRLINSRFSVREKNTFEIVDRVGENDTNIYNSKTFDKDTALYFQYESDPLIEYKGLISGSLPVGQYCFYLTYCDADDNESDFIAETGVIPVFIGSDKDPYSMDGGIKNQSSNKGIRLKISNLDKAYNYLKVYYVRYFADYQENRVTEGKKLYKKFAINSNILYLGITGEEEAEDIDPNILNITRFNPQSVTTATQCKNMLFQAHIVKNADNYKELRDCALRIVPELYPLEFGNVNDNYYSQDYGYYNSYNIYNKVGYFDEEYYRFAVVFIYNNGTLSTAYNVLGRELTGADTPKCSEDIYEGGEGSGYLTRTYIPISNDGWISSDHFGGKGSFLNAKGVCRFNYSGENKENTIFGVKFNIPDEVTEHLESLGIRGLFFTRQKRMPIKITQCYLLPMDEQLEGPILEIKDKDNNKTHYQETFVTQEGQYVSNYYEDRLYKYKGPNAISRNAYAGICPDFLLNQPYYNQIFNGNKFKLKRVTEGAGLVREGRMYYEGEPKKEDNSIFKGSRSLEGKYFNTIKNSIAKEVTINTVTEDVRTVAIKKSVYRLDIGKAQEAFRFSYAEEDNGTYDVGTTDFKSVNEATNIVRGTYSPYLAIYSESPLETSELYDVYLDNEYNPTQEYQIRMDSSQDFYAISNRYNFNNLDLKGDTRTLTCWRGDCYTNTFTYRFNRNFNDASLPNNDKIIDKETWKKHYKVEKPEEWAKIVLADLNAVQMGSWITIRVKSYMNYALRSQDHSYVSEEALMGAPRSFYPRSSLLWRGENKMPDSYLYNDAYRNSLGFKCYQTLNDPNYVKNTFSNRIQYSAIAIQDSFKNNYRDSLSTYNRDYSQEYGSITKILGFEGYLLVVFEHAIGAAIVNERILAAEGEGTPVFINTQNVLSEELTIISDTFGSQWAESIVKTEVGYVYGVDTIAKKLWRVQGQQIEILSDFKVGKFLNENITLGERELTPIIGIRNVKTHYNNNKKDVIFTFYDNIYKDEEKVWSLCYNEQIGQFVTFYSWVPSYSENIDTQFFTFDRNTSKWLTLLSSHNYNNPDTEGVLVDSPVLNNGQFTLYYKDNNLYNSQTVINDDGTTYTIEIDPEKNNCITNVSFIIEKDHWGNYNLVHHISDNTYSVDLPEVSKGFNSQRPVLLLDVTPVIQSTNQDNSNVTITKFKTETIALTLKDYLNNPKLTKDEKAMPSLGTDFYLHGRAGIFDVTENVYPTKWYDKVHPFEFEFVVNETIFTQKVFNNLIIIGNKAEPESFHFEVEGDNYEFSSDKRTMYFRQEKTKQLYQLNGSDMLYNRKYRDVTGDYYTEEQYYRAKDDEYMNQYSNIDKVYPISKNGLVQQMKSTIFPLYYERVDTYDDIYDQYRLMTGEGKYDFKNLSGSEIVWDRDLNQFNIVTHIKNSPIDLVGRLRGNSRYVEGRWNIQIPSITFNQKNEEKWEEPPVVITSDNVPADVTEIVKNIYKDNYIEVGDWTSRKETRIRDKWLKVRIRYSGKNLATIYSVITLFNVSKS